MSLDGDVLGGELVASNNNLVGVELGLGDCLGFQEGLKGDDASGSDSVEGIQLDEVVFLLGVSRSRGSAGELGQSAVQWVLSSLESRSGGSSRTRLLSTHTETAGGSLSSRDTTSLTGLGLAGSGGGSEGIKGEFVGFNIVDVGFVSVATLPVVNLHGEVAGGSRDGREAGSGERREGI